MLPSLAFMPEVITATTAGRPGARVPQGRVASAWSAVRSIQDRSSPSTTIRVPGPLRQGDPEDPLRPGPGGSPTGTIAMDGRCELLQGRADGLRPAHHRRLKPHLRPEAAPGPSSPTALESVLPAQCREACTACSTADNGALRPHHRQRASRHFGGAPVKVRQRAAFRRTRSTAGKPRNKEHLQQEMGLDVNPGVPVIAIISRLCSFQPRAWTWFVRSVFDQIMDLNCQFCGPGQRRDMETYERFFEGGSWAFTRAAWALSGATTSLWPWISYAVADLLLHATAAASPGGWPRCGHAATPPCPSSGDRRAQGHRAPTGLVRRGQRLHLRRLQQRRHVYVQVRQAVDFYFNNPTAFKQLRQRPAWD